MVRPPTDYYLVMAMRTPTRRHHHHELPARPKGPTLRERIRALATRTTLGPQVGDHVLGESQWSPRAATR